MSNTGFFLLALAFIDPFLLAAVFMYVIIYLLSLFGIFIVLISLRLYGKNHFIGKLSDLINVSQLQSALFLFMAIFFFSLGSIPPVLGFFGKVPLIVGMLNIKMQIVIILLLFVSIVSLVVYLRFLKVSFFIRDGFNFNLFINIPFSFSIILVFIFFFNLLVLIFPSVTYF